MPNNWQSPFVELAYFIRNFLSLQPTPLCPVYQTTVYTLLSHLMTQYEKLSFKLYFLHFINWTSFKVRIVNTAYT